MKRLSKFLDKNLMVINTPTTKLSIFGLAIPIFLENIGAHLIAMIQTILSSNFMDGFFVSPMNIAVSAAAPITTLSTVVTVGLNIVLSINLGRGNQKDSAKIVGTAIYANFLFSIFLNSIVSFFAEPIISFMGYNTAEYAEAFPYAVNYLKKQSIVLMVIRITGCFLTILRCYGYTKIGMYSTLISSAVLTGLTAIMLFVISPAKEHVVDGFIICRLIVRIAEAIILYLVLLKKKISISFKLSRKWFKEIFRIGFPANIANLAYTISSVLTVKICVSLGPDPYLARIYIQQIVFFVYTFGACVGVANSIMIGRLCGMGDLDKADKMHRQNIRLIMLVNGILSLLCIPIGILILRFGFNASDIIIALSVPVFIIDFFVEVGRGMNHIGQNGLNATKDVKFTTMVSIIAVFLFSVGLAYVFGVIFKLGISGIWLAYAVDEISRGILYYFRWRKGRWRKRFKAEEEKFKNEVSKTQPAPAI